MCYKAEIYGLMPIERTQIQIIYFRYIVEDMDGLWEESPYTYMLNFI